MGCTLRLCEFVHLERRHVLVPMQPLRLQRPCVSPLLNSEVAFQVRFAEPLCLVSLPLLLAACCVCPHTLMSFADVVPGRGIPLGAPGGASGGAPGAAGEDQFQSTARAVASSVFQLTTNVTSFKRLVDAMVRVPALQGHRALVCCALLWGARPWRRATTRVGN